MTAADIRVRTRDDGFLEGVWGPVTAVHDRSTIAGRMGWKDSGRAAGVISKTLALLSQGKAVKLTSHYGYCIFQPLALDEDGRGIPASRGVVYNADGEVVERVVG